MTKKQIKELEKQIEELKNALKQMDLSESNINYDINDYRLKQRELNRLRILRDSEKK